MLIIYYCKLENFARSLFSRNFANEKICEKNPHEIAKFICHLLMQVYHALVAILNVTNVSFNDI